MNISVLGCGRWATFLAWYSQTLNHNVMIWGRETSKNYKELKEERKNKYLELDKKTLLSNSLDEAINFGNIIIISISAQNLRDLLRNIKNIKNHESKTYVLCMKGIESSTGKRLSEVFKEELGEDISVAVWLGPGHVQDFTRGIPNCMILCSDNIETTMYLEKALNGPLIRFYYGDDIIGCEVGAATKNIIGIAAGILDGLGYSSLKGSLMARGPKEIAMLVKKMGGKKTTVYGLSHIGDYEATLFSPYSNNRKFGEDFVLGKNSEYLAEGVATIKAIKTLSEKYNIEMPINNALYNIIFEKQNIDKNLQMLFSRETKFEF